jgi:predicted nucleic-acid-binding Zn-ribbon protein
LIDSKSMIEHNLLHNIFRSDESHQLHHRPPSKQSPKQSKVHKCSVQNGGKPDLSSAGEKTKDTLSVPKRYFCVNTSCVQCVQAS